MKFNFINPLGKIRRFLGKTQHWADNRCNLRPGAFARREGNEDIRLSTLLSTLNDFDLKAYIVIKCSNGDEIKINLTENQNG
ncbi:TPA: hypothetical protein O4I50_001230 [Vibrio parahaemolyticus]|nr:hypothetical protein [Vibrio parahaemolyticus]